MMCCCKRNQNMHNCYVNIEFAIILQLEMANFYHVVELQLKFRKLQS